MRFVRLHFHIRTSVPVSFDQVCWRKPYRPPRLDYSWPCFDDPKGCLFASLELKCRRGPIAQLKVGPVDSSIGRWFESFWAHHFRKHDHTESTRAWDIRAFQSPPRGVLTSSPRKSMLAPNNNPGDLVAFTPSLSIKSFCGYGD